MRSHHRDYIKNRFHRVHPAPHHINSSFATRLCCEAIIQAVADLVAKPRADRGGKKKGRAKPRACERNASIEWNRDRARQWLFGDSQDFRDVCDVAYIAPVTVRELATKIEQEVAACRK